jgi:hypothetical protein
MEMGSWAGAEVPTELEEFAMECVASSRPVALLAVLPVILRSEEMEMEMEMEWWVGVEVPRELE